MYRADARLFHIRGTGPQPIAVQQFGFNDNPCRPGSSTSSSSRTVVSHAIVPHSSRQHCRMRPSCPHALACHPHFSHVWHPIVRIEHITGVSSVSSCTRLHAYAHRAQSGPLHVRFTQSGHHWLRHPKTPPYPDIQRPDLIGPATRPHPTYAPCGFTCTHAQHTHLHTHTHTHTNTNKHTHLHTDTHTHKHTHAHPNTDTHTHTHTHPSKMICFNLDALFLPEAPVFVFILCP